MIGIINFDFVKATNVEKKFFSVSKVFWFSNKVIKLSTKKTVQKFLQEYENYYRYPDKNRII